MTNPQRTADPAASYAPAAIAPYFCWHDLMTDDVAAARAYYGALFGWTFSEMDMGDAGAYTMIHAGGEGIGGMMSMPRTVVPPSWLCYLAVPDVDDLCARAPGLGATVQQPPHDIPGTGRFARIRDPLGAVWSPITLVSPAEPPAVPAAGTFCWHELLTHDVPRMTEYFRALLGWRANPMDMGPGRTYWLLGGTAKGAPDRAGMMPMPADAPAPSDSWLPYVAVADVDAASKQVTKLGGTIAVPPTDIPNVGRFSVTMDVAGAMLALYRAK